MTTEPKPSDLPFIGISKPITQAESKRLPQIIPVLEYIQENRLFSAKQLEKSIKVSRDSIDRTLRSLEQKKIIELKEIRTRGEKFYKIKSESEFNSYLYDLREWCYAKIMLKNPQKMATKLKKITMRSIKKAKYISRHPSKVYLKKSLTFVSKERQMQMIKNIPYPNPVIIHDLPYTQASKIANIYKNGLLCETCLKENKISFLISQLDEQVCELGHVES